MSNPNDSTETTRRRFLLSGLAVGCLATASVAEPVGARAAAADGDGIGTVWWVELVSADDTRSAEYYSAIMSWDVKRTALADSTRAAGPDEATYSLFSSSGTEVAGALKADANSLGKDKPAWIVYFRVESVEKAIDKALKQGGRLLMQPFDGPDVRMAVLSDLDGVPFGIAAPITSAG